MKKINIAIIYAGEHANRNILPILSESKKFNLKGIFIRSKKKARVGTLASDISKKFYASSAAAFLSDSAVRSQSRHLSVRDTPYLRSARSLVIG